MSVGVVICLLLGGGQLEESVPLEEGGDPLVKTRAEGQQWILESFYCATHMRGDFCSVRCPEKEGKATG